MTNWVRAWRRRPRLGLGVVAALLVLLLSAHALGLWRVAPLARLDLVLYDLRLAALASDAPDDRIVLVDIDARSLATHGRWPWPRSLLAELIDRLGGPLQAKLVALDVVMAEPEALVGMSAAEADQAAPAAATAAPGNDARLAYSLARWPTVLGFMLSDNPAGNSVGVLPPPLMAAGLLGPRLAALHAYPSATGNLPLLQEAAGQAGHLNAQVDADGRLRRVPLLARGPDGRVVASLALAAAQRALGPPGRPVIAPQAQPSADADARLPLRGLRLATAAQPRWVPLGPHGEVLVPFKRSARAFAHWSAADVLGDQLPAGALRGKLVLVGVNAAGLVDERMTPLDDQMQGSLVHANLLSGLLDGSLRTTPALAPLFELAALVVVAVVMVWGLRRLGMVRAGLLTATLMLGLVLMNAAAWAWGQWALPLAAPLLLPPLLLAAHLALAYRAATGARARLSQLFGQYVPPELVHEMSREPERHSMSSRSAELTVLFADVRGFSGLAERLPPGELSAMMNLIFSHLTDAVQAQRGTLDKYIGDAVMAFWGAPLDDPRHAEHAVAAALAMRAQLPAIHAALRARGWPSVDVQIGINTGAMVVGDMGSRHRRAYTVMGDAVNLAARLQQLCSQEQLGLVVGDATQRALGSRWCLSLGRLPLRGREQAEPAWLPLPWLRGEKAAVDQAAQLWQAMRQAVDANDGARALALLSRIETLAPGLAPTDWQRRQLKAAADH